MKEKRWLEGDAQLVGETLSAPPAAKRQDAQGARVVRYCCPGEAATDWTEDAQSYRSIWTGRGCNQGRRGPPTEGV